jgi:DNA-nicking Smr family endonuclease
VNGEERSVVGVHERDPLAGRHGGAGALYVYLRRRKPAG